MWLINTTSLQLEFVEDSDKHTYAILSHTWEHGEVSFHDIADLNQACKKPGFSKIKRTCQLARGRGIRYAWVDTCCIDKSSSAELTEAINSMFRWYKSAVICFVFFSDLPAATASEDDSEEDDSEDEDVLEEYLPKCRWFSRGWTLQELVAPNKIVFFDQKWNDIGDKVSLQHELSKITNIDIDVLENSDLMSTIPVARRMSWAAKRCTSRLEDLSYCLFGIFNINLPLIYGEGTNAFIRLQEAIASDNNDLSLFAWTSQENDQNLRGIFAHSPSEFERCGSLERITDPIFPTAEFAMTNKGFHITTRLTTEDCLMNLQCSSNTLPPPVALDMVTFIRLCKTAHGYVRQNSNQLIEKLYSDSHTSEVVDVYVPKVISPTESHALELRLAHRFKVVVKNGSDCTCVVKERPEHLWDRRANSFITNGHEKFIGLLDISFKYAEVDLGRMMGCIVVIGFEAHDDNMKNKAVEEGNPLKPWAAIYKREGLDRISWILRNEQEYGLPFVLSRMSAILHTRASNDRPLPRYLALSQGLVKYKNPFNEEEVKERPSIELNFSIDLTVNRGHYMYELSLNVENKD